MTTAFTWELGNLPPGRTRSRSRPPGSQPHPTPPLLPYNSWVQGPHFPTPQQTPQLLLQNRNRLSPFAWGGARSPLSSSRLVQVWGERGRRQSRPGESREGDHAFPRPPTFLVGLHRAGPIPGGLWKYHHLSGFECPSDGTNFPAIITFLTCQFLLLKNPANSPKQKPVS